METSLRFSIVEKVRPVDPICPPLRVRKNRLRYELDELYRLMRTGEQVEMTDADHNKAVYGSIDLLHPIDRYNGIYLVGVGTNRFEVYVY